MMHTLQTWGVAAVGLSANITTRCQHSSGHSHRNRQEAAAAAYQPRLAMTKHAQSVFGTLQIQKTASVMRQVFVTWYKCHTITSLMMDVMSQNWSLNVMLYQQLVLRTKCQMSTALW